MRSHNNSWRTLLLFLTLDLSRFIDFDLLKPRDIKNLASELRGLVQATFIQHLLRGVESRSPQANGTVDIFKITPLNESSYHPLMDSCFNRVNCDRLCSRTTFFEKCHLWDSHWIALCMSCLTKYFMSWKSQVARSYHSLLWIGAFLWGSFLWISF